MINMKKIYWLSLLLLNAYLLDAQSYRKLHFRSTVVDTHNDILTTAISKGYSFDQDLTGKTHSDLARMLAGGIDVLVFFCVVRWQLWPGKSVCTRQQAD